jgi:hypothetical protein
MAKDEPHKQDEVAGPCGHYGVVGKEIRKDDGAYRGLLHCETCGYYEHDFPADAIPPLIRGLIDKRGQLTESDLKYLGVFRSLALGWK